MATAQSIFTVIIKSIHDETIMDNDDIKDCYFIEDIYSYLMTGRIILKDTRALVEMLPLVGTETITIEYGTVLAGAVDSHKIKSFTFDIIKMGFIEGTADRHRQLIELFFIQTPHKRLHMENYSRSFKCERYTDYAKWIMANHCGIDAFGEFEDGMEVLQYFYTGLKTPAQNIEWLSSRASGLFSGQPGYLLFANTKYPDAPYNYVTLEKLLQNGVLMPPEAGPYTINAHNDYNINRILNYQDHRVDKKGLDKLIGNIGLGFDTKRKKYLRNIYTYQEALEKFTCLGNFSLFDKIHDETLSVNQVLTGEVEELEIMSNLYYGDWIKRYCLQHTVDTVIEGHVDRYAGGIIEIGWPSASDDEVYDANMAGLYLVKSITHHFVPMNKPVYMQKMILIKNGYDISTGSLTPAVNANVQAIAELERANNNEGIRWFVL